MARPGYINYHAKEGTPRQQMLDRLCRRLGLDTSHRSRIAAIDAAVSAAVMDEKVKGEDSE
jgi:DNA polymerase III epsilon subunit-like protein